MVHERRYDTKGCRIRSATGTGAGVVRPDPLHWQRGTVPAHGGEALAGGARAYAAVIASFVGALQWGYAVRDGLEGASAWRGVVPALAGWVALLLPVQTGLALLAATLLLCLVVDHSFARSRPGPAWLLVPLHTALTAGGAACLPACWTCCGHFPMCSAHGPLRRQGSARTMRAISRAWPARTPESQRVRAVRRRFARPPEAAPTAPAAPAPCTAPSRGWPPSP